MTDEQIKELLNMFTNLPDPEQQPRVFDYYVRVYKFMKGIR
mgnify:FL=1|jgi:hypothetical protein